MGIPSKPSLCLDPSISQQENSQKIPCSAQPRTPIPALFPLPSQDPQVIPEAGNARAWHCPKPVMCSPRSCQRLPPEQINPPGLRARAVVSPRLNQIYRPPPLALPLSRKEFHRLREGKGRKGEKSGNAEFSTWNNPAPEPEPPGWAQDWWHRSPSKAGTARLGGTRGPPDITGATLGCRVTTEGRLNPCKPPALPAALLN